MTSNFVSLAKEALFNVAVVIFIILMISVESIFACDYGLSDNEFEAYMKLCPYGDAVLVLKDGSTKDVQCVNYDPIDRVWETMEADSFKNLLYGMEVIFGYYPVDMVKTVSTMDGEITVIQAEADIKNKDLLISNLIK